MRKFIHFKNGATLVYSRYRRGGNATALACGFFCGVDYTKNGVSHAVEHMLFLGTRNRSKQDILKDRRDITFLAANTYAKFMEVDFFCSNRRLEKGCEFASDVLFNTKASEEDIKNEVEVIKQERERSRSNYMISHPRRHLLWLTQEYGGTIDGYLAHWFGTDETLANLSLDTIEAFKKEHFVSNKFVAFASSTLPLYKIKRLLNKYFISRLSPASGPEKERIVYPDIVAEPGTMVIKKPDAAVFDCRLTILQRTDECEKLRFNYDRTFIRHAINYDPELYENKLRELGLVYAASVDFFNNYNHDITFDFTFTTSKLENIPLILGVIGDTISSLKVGGITPQQFEAYREAWLISEDMPHPYTDNMGAVRNMIPSFQLHLDASPYIGMNRRKWKKHMQKSTIESINKTISEQFDSKNDLYFSVMGNLDEADLLSIDEVRKLVFK